jgi:hypothetical protein
MDTNLLRSYLTTVYELPTATGALRASLDGDAVASPSSLPEILQKPFAIVTGYNPRSMLLPRRVNEQRNLVMRDLLVTGNYRVEACAGFEDDPEGTWREPSWLVHGMERDEAIAFGRVFRQNAVLLCRNARPEIVVTDPTCDEIGKTYEAWWRVRT